MMHKAAHELDASSGSFSSSTEFKNAVEKDSCWADSQAKEGGDKGIAKD